MTTEHKKFNVRSFVALMVLFAGVGLPVTGIANHLCQFDSLTTERHAWMTAHNVLALLFVVFAVWHCILNRRGLWGHIKGIAPCFPSVSREALFAAGVVAVIVLVSVSHAFHAGGRP